MLTFEELYTRLARASVNNDLRHELEKIKDLDYDPYHLDCLLHPQKHDLVWKVGDCTCSPEEKESCKEKCKFDVLFQVDEKNTSESNKDACSGCSSCVDHCKAEKLKASRDILPALEAVHSGKGPVYALIAPAFLGQFKGEISAGKLRNAFKKIGFDGMVEVALFADILTLKEALEFDKNIQTEGDFQLTSCCCPLWISMIRKVYNELMPHVPGSVSPMIACGRAVKKLHPDAITIFVGPCLAKKAEAREPDLKGAIDFVLTFQEVQDIFDFAGIDPTKMQETTKEHSSKSGRIYARSGGVSQAVRETLDRINPDRKIKIKTERADGVKACKEMINRLLNKEINANFFEGMGCVGGCVGGPKAIIDKNDATQHVEKYGNEATYPTPIDNPYVIELLHRLGFDTVESFLEDDELFVRRF